MLTVSCRSPAEWSASAIDASRTPFVVNASSSSGFCANGLGQVDAGPRERKARAVDQRGRHLEAYLGPDPRRHRRRGERKDGSAQMTKSRSSNIAVAAPRGRTSLFRVTTEFAGTDVVTNALPATME